MHATAAALGARPATCRQAAQASSARLAPRTALRARVLHLQRPAATATTAAARRGRQRCTPVPPRAQSKEEEGVAAVGQDLEWPHVAADVKRRLASVVGGHASTADRLQGW